MTLTMRALFTGLCLGLWLAVGAVFAQDEPSQNINRWENVATSAETVVDEKTALPIAPRETSVIYDVRHKRHMDEPPPTTQPSSRRSSFGMTMRGGGWRRKKR